MPTFFIVRATIPDPAQRAAFDEWYAEEHLPDAVKSFGAQKAWRFWSDSTPRCIRRRISSPTARRSITARGRKI